MKKVAKGLALVATLAVGTAACGSSSGIHRAASIKGHALIAKTTPAKPDPCEQVNALLKQVATAKSEATTAAAKAQAEDMAKALTADLKVCASS